MKLRFILGTKPTNLEKILLAFGVLCFLTGQTIFSGSVGFYFILAGANLYGIAITLNIIRAYKNRFYLKDVKSEIQHLYSQTARSRIKYLYILSIFAAIVLYVQISQQDSTTLQSPVRLFESYQQTSDCIDINGFRLKDSVEVFISPVDPEYSDAFKLAMHKWNMLNSTLKLVPFVETSNRHAADVVVVFVPNLGESTHGMFTANNYVPDSQLRSKNLSKNVLKSFNQGVLTVYYGSVFLKDENLTLKSNWVQIFYISTHELGHVLGLGHSNDDDSIMKTGRSLISAIQATQLRINDRIIKTLEWIYSDIGELKRCNTD